MSPVEGHAGAPDGGGWESPCDELGRQHLDLAGLRLLDLGQMDGEDAVAVLGLDPLRIHRDRKSERAREGAVETLHSIGVLGSKFLLPLPLTFEGEDVVLDLNINIVAVDTRKLRRHDDVVPILMDVAQRGPRAHRLLGAHPRKGRICEDSAHPVLKSLKIVDERLESHESHRLLLLIVLFNCLHPGFPSDPRRCVRYNMSMILSIDLRKKLYTCTNNCL